MTAEMLLSLNEEIEEVWRHGVSLTGWTGLTGFVSEPPCRKPIRRSSYPFRPDAVAAAHRVALRLTFYKM